MNYTYSREQLPQLHGYISNSETTFGPMFPLVRILHSELRVNSVVILALSFEVVSRNKSDEGIQINLIVLFE